MISVPVRAFHSFQVASGSTSPAETAKRSELVSSLFPCRTCSSSMRNTVGTPKKMVGRYFANTSLISAGEGRSLSRMVEAPPPSGIDRLLPRP